MQLSVIERGTLVTVSVCVVLESDRQPIKTEESPIHHLCFDSWMLRKVMETAEIPKMVTTAALAGGLEEKIERMGSQRITVSDHMNRLPSTADKSKNFVIDMESFAAKDVPPYSRITKSLSKKWSHRSSDEKTTPNGNTNEKKNEKDPILPSPSPRACGQGVATVPEKSIVGTTLDQHCSSQQAHHQITITTLNPTTNTETIRESRYARRNSFRRSSSSSSSWVLDPKRVLFVFASLSSIGTILLIYFTLAIGGTVLDLEQ